MQSEQGAGTNLDKRCSKKFNISRRGRKKKAPGSETGTNSGVVLPLGSRLSQVKQQCIKKWKGLITGRKWPFTFADRMNLRPGVHRQ